MNNTTWTDEQLAAQLQQWSKALRRGEVVHAALTVESVYPFAESQTGYWLQFADDGKVDLTLSQAQRVQGWMQSEQKARPTNEMRDTQFAGFAARLLQELLDQGAYVAISEWATGGDSFKSEQLIARRAYDLVCHVAAEIADETKDYLVIIEKIPDMPEWPEETSK